MHTARVGLHVTCTLVPASPSGGSVSATFFGLGSDKNCEGWLAKAEACGSDGGAISPGSPGSGIDAVSLGHRRTNAEDDQGHATVLSVVRLGRAGSCTATPHAKVSAGLGAQQAHESGGEVSGADLRATL